MREYCSGKGTATAEGKVDTGEVAVVGRAVVVGIVLNATNCKRKLLFVGVKSTTKGANPVLVAVTLYAVCVWNP